MLFFKFLFHKLEQSNFNFWGIEPTDSEYEFLRQE